MVWREDFLRRPYTFFDGLDIAVEALHDARDKHKTTMDELLSFRENLQRRKQNAALLKFSYYVI